MKHQSKIRSLFATGLLSAAVVLFPLGAWAEDEHEHENECKDCGVVTAVKVVENASSGLVGAAAGAVAGGVAGNQVGQATGANTSTIGSMATALLGAAGGAIGGHYAEKAMTGNKSWEVSVKMDEGKPQTVSLTAEPKVKVGDHVQIKGSSVEIYKGEDQKKED